MRLMSIRRATVDDAEAIAGLHVRSWQTAYRGHMPDELLDGLDPAAWAAGRRRRLQRGDSGDVTLVAETDGRIVGFTIAGDNGTGEGEVFAIYVDPPEWGTGAGRRLMDAAVAHLTTTGHRAVRLWVLDGNERARRFYERYGFVADGARDWHAVGDSLRVPTVRYTLAPS